MGQHNMEQDFRDKLNKRTIGPSPAAWDRLDTMLAVAEAKKPKRPYSGLYVAAAILGFILVTTVYLAQTEEVVDKGIETYVTAPDKGGQKKADDALQTVKQEPIGPPFAAKQNAVAVTESSHHPPSIPAAQKVLHQENVAQNSPQPDQPAVVDQKSEPIEKPIYINVDELLASVDSKGEKAVKSTQVPFSGRDKVKVDPNSLLSQVDGELDLTFREKTLRTISKQYKTVKGALASRNKE